jgi:hypothetical protein
MIMLVSADAESWQDDWQDERWGITNISGEPGGLSDMYSDMYGGEARWRSRSGAGSR